MYHNWLYRWFDMILNFIIVDMLYTIHSIHKTSLCENVALCNIAGSKGAQTTRHVRHLPQRADDIMGC